MRLIIVKFVAILVLLSLFGCGDTELVRKSMHFVSRFNGDVKIEYFKGISMFSRGGGVDRYDFDVFHLQSTVTTFEDINIEFPVVVEWSLVHNDGTLEKRKKIIETISGIETSRISEKCIIWVFFDEHGDLGISYFPGDQMRNPDVLFEDGITEEGNKGQSCS